MVYRDDLGAQIICLLENVQYERHSLHLEHIPAGFIRRSTVRDQEGFSREHDPSASIAIHIRYITLCKPALYEPLIIIIILP